MSPFINPGIVKIHAQIFDEKGAYMKIEKIVAREIFDSRGMPTVECDILLEEGIQVSASVPTGASKSDVEVVEMRDGGTRLMGMGVLDAVAVIEQEIAPHLIGKEPDLVTMDVLMLDLDGTANKAKLGGNSMLAVSMAVLKAQAVSESLETHEMIAHICGYESIALPLPMFNMINGGAHAHNALRIQEFLAVPINVPSFRAAMESAVVLHHELEALLVKNDIMIAVGDEGGFAGNFKSETQAFDFLMEAIEFSSKKIQGSFVLAIDVAASQFYDVKKKKYNFGGKSMSSDQMIAYYEKLAKKYSLYSIEDGLSQHDWDGWKDMTQALYTKVQLVGDDIFATNPELIWKGIEQGVATASIIKPNQIGTITETLQAIKLCKEHDMNVVVSHRSGETNDAFIADLAVGTSSGHIKAGGLSRGERMAKYNHLLRIEDTLALSLLDA
jgi:enolase